MNNKKICIIGNSVALRVRPTEEFPNNKNYFQYLQEYLDDSYSLHNLGYGALTVKDVYKNLDNYINIFPNYYILNLGVVDASTREVPLWFYRLATKKNLNLFFIFFALFYRNIISKIRKPLVYLRGKTSWISKRKFEKYFELIVSNLLKETNAQIIILSINKANNRIETQLPGSLKNHKLFNGIMREIAEKYSQKFINTNDLITQDDYPDGVHFSKNGHIKIAEKIKSVIRNFQN